MSDNAEQLTPEQLADAISANIGSAVKLAKNVMHDMVPNSKGPLELVLAVGIMQALAVGVVARETGTSLTLLRHVVELGVQTGEEAFKDAAARVDAEEGGASHV